MRLGECSVDGFVRAQFNKTKGIHGDAFLVKRKLRKKTRRSAEVAVRIVEPIRVELELVVVPVEVRRVREVGGTVSKNPCPSVSPKLESSCH